jgi:hypothetical protein
MLYYIINEMY